MIFTGQSYPRPQMASGVIQEGTIGVEAVPR